MTIENLYQRYLQHPTICTDTRNIESNCIFFALKGANFDAHTFTAEALKKGAAYVIIDNPTYQIDERTILVADVLAALQQVATWHRLQLQIPVIGLTGTNGKTTTKELIYAVLSQKYQTHATKGNLNNHIGVPLTLLSMPPNTQIAIIEMGANHPEEIAFLCEIAQPTHGLITNVGKAHLEGFGGFEGVKKTKAELYQWLSAHQGVVFINSENTYLNELKNKYIASNINCIQYGTAKNNTVSAHILQQQPYLGLAVHYQQYQEKINTQLTGIYNFENILASLAIGCFFNMELPLIKKGLEQYQPQNNRSQILKTEKNTLICDYYNANPSSMAVALENLAAFTGTPKIAILGDMFELGEETAAEHQHIIEKALQAQCETLIFVGKYFYNFQHQYNANFFIDTTAAKYFLAQAQFTQHICLIKGSRGMALEQLIPLL